MWGGHSWVRDQRNSVQHQRWTQDKDNGSIYQEYHQKGLQEIPKSSGDMVEYNGDFE